MLTIKTLAGFYLVRYEMLYIILESWLWFTRGWTMDSLFFFVFFIFLYSIYLEYLSIYIFTECHVSPLTLLTWLDLRVFSHNTWASCHAPVSLDQSEPELESCWPIGGRLVTCDQGHGDLRHHISSASVRSLGQHVGSERDRDTLSTSDKSKATLIWKQNT